MTDQRIGKYRVVRELGRGGMGVVYEAMNEQISRRAAIKLLFPELAQNAEFAARFLNEARAANIVHHPGIVNVFEFGQTLEGAPYIVLEFLEGETLWSRLSRRGRLQKDTLRLGRQLASALTAAHAKNVIHRDLKPENVMLVHDPEVPGGERTKILDFGLAKLAAELKGPGATHLRTRSGTIMGTVLYMSPEQCRGAGAVDHKTDVYSLGVMLYEMLVGHPPFNSEGAGELIGMHLHVEPPPLRSVDPEVPEELAALVHRMMRKDPQQRPAMAEVAAELERLGAPKATGPVVSTIDDPAWGAPTTPQAPAMSSLAHAAGQSQQQIRRGTKFAALGGAAVMALVLAAVGVLVQRSRKMPPPAPAAVTQPAPAKKEPPPAVATPIPAPAAVPPAPALTSPPATPAPAPPKEAPMPKPVPIKKPPAKPAVPKKIGVPAKAAPAAARPKEAPKVPKPENKEQDYEAKPID